MKIWIDPRGNDAHDGNETTPLLTLNEGFRRAQPGDTLIARPGVYRETVSPVRSGEAGQPIRLVAEVPHSTVVRGSIPLTETPPSPGVHRFPVPSLERNPFAIPLDGSRIGGTLGQVFLGETMLREVMGSEMVSRLPGTWCALDDGTEVLVHVPPSLPAPLEITVLDCLFRPAQVGMGYLEVEGVVFERCANQSAASFWVNGRKQEGAVSLASAHHMVIRNCVVRHAKTIGIDLGVGGGVQQPDDLEPHDNLIEGCHVVENGEVGACGRKTRRTTIRGCVVERNALLSPHTVEEAGLKFHQFTEGLIEGNLVRDNNAAGIWLDAMWVDARVSRNVVLNNLGSGIFIELGSDRVQVDNNIVAYTRLGDGIYAHDASDALIAHNLVFGSAHYGIYMRYVTDRPFPHRDGVTRPAECSRNRVLNNLFIDNYRGHLCLPANSTRSHDNVSDCNWFLNGTQWQWEGLPFHRFCLGDNDGDIPGSEVVTQLASVGVSDRGPEGGVDIGTWQRLGFDRNSFAPPAFRITKENGAVVKGTATLAPNDLYFELRLGPDAVAPAVPSLPECEFDVDGQRREAMSSPGPFATLGEGHHRFDITPR